MWFTEHSGVEVWKGKIVGVLHKALCHEDTQGSERRILESWVWIPIKECMSVFILCLCWVDFLRRTDPRPRSPTDRLGLRNWRMPYASSGSNRSRRKRRRKRRRRRRRRIEGGKWSGSRPRENSRRYPLDRRLGRSQIRFGRLCNTERHLFLPGIEPRPSSQ
jgi:hypothetical protein